MQKQIGVWIDLKRAAIVSLEKRHLDFKIIPSLIERRERVPGQGKAFSRFGTQYMEFERKKENRLEAEIRAFLRKVVSEMGDAGEIVLLGPAGMKMELDKFMRKNKLFVGKVKSVETTDNMTDNQIAAWVRNYYHR